MPAGWPSVPSGMLPPPKSPEIGRPWAKFRRFRPKLIDSGPILANMGPKSAEIPRLERDMAKVWCWNRPQIGRTRADRSGHHPRPRHTQRKRSFVGASEVRDMGAPSSVRSPRSPKRRAGARRRRRGVARIAAWVAACPMVTPQRIRLGAQLVVRKRAFLENGPMRGTALGALALAHSEQLWHALGAHTPRMQSRHALERTHSVNVHFGQPILVAYSSGTLGTQNLVDVRRGPPAPRWRASSQQGAWVLCTFVERQALTGFLVGTEHALSVCLECSRRVCAPGVCQ